MSDPNVTTLQLSEEDADRLARLVRSGAYASPEAAVSEALAALEDASAPELEAWLRDIVAERYDSYAADPSRAIPLAEVRRQLLGFSEE